MLERIPEPDWKVFREIHKPLLRRHCRETLDRLAEIAAQDDEDAHEQYLRAYKYIHQRDKEVAEVFEDFRRSTALMQLGLMRRKKLLDDSDLDRFSEETAAVIRRFTHF